MYSGNTRVPTNIALGLVNETRIEWLNILSGDTSTSLTKAIPEVFLKARKAM